MEHVYISKVWNPEEERFALYGYCNNWLWTQMKCVLKRQVEDIEMKVNTMLKQRIEDGTTINELAIEFNKPIETIAAFLNADCTLI